MKVGYIVVFLTKLEICTLRNIEEREFIFKLANLIVEARRQHIYTRMFTQFSCFLYQKRSKHLNRSPYRPLQQPLPHALLPYRIDDAEPRSETSQITKDDSTPKYFV